MRRTVGQTLATLAVVAWFTLAANLPADAATWCVPDASVRPVCTVTASTVQAAIDAAALGSKIFIGSTVQPGRVQVTRRMSLVCLDGATLSDWGLPTSPGPVVHIAAPRATIENCRVDVRHSAGGVLLDPAASFVQMKGLVITGGGDTTPEYGMRTYDNPRVFFIGGKQRPAVSGFLVGIDSRGGGWLDVEAGPMGGVLVSGNGTGIRTIHDKGQIFFNEVRNNGVGIEVRGDAHVDINANQYIDNGVGLLWGLATTPNPSTGCTSQKTMEVNHPVFLGNGAAILVEVTPGTLTRDYTQDPGLGTQWTNMRIAGVLMPNYKTTYVTHVCQP